MIDHLNSNDLLNDIQSGFRRFYNTTSALLKVTEDIRKNIDRRRVTFLLLLDFSKAFDCIDHSIMCKKIKVKFKFSGRACDLIYSYLSDRSVCVDINGNMSKTQFIYSGVPQGSVLGPILFTLYINDVVNVLSFSTPHQFADDLQLYKSSDIDDKSLDQAVVEINDDLKSVHCWSICNRLDLNCKKTQAIVIYNAKIDHCLLPIMLNGLTIPYSDKVKNLGIILNSLFTWDDHVAYVCSKVYGMLRKLYSVSEFIPRKLRRKLVVSLILPYFLYGDIVFMECSAICKRKLEVCFNACIRFVFNLRKFDSIGNRLNSIVGCSLFAYYNFRLAVFVYKIISFRQPSYLYREFQFAISGRTNNLIMPVFNSAVANISFRVKSVRVWNSLPNFIKSSRSLQSFKNSCKRFYFIS